MTDERNTRQGQAGEETTCDLTIQQPDQSSVFQDHQVESKLKNTKYKFLNSQTSPWSSKNARYYTRPPVTIQDENSKFKIAKIGKQLSRNTLFIYLYGRPQRLWEKRLKGKMSWNFWEQLSGSQFCWSCRRSCSIRGDDQGWQYDSNSRLFAGSVELKP